MTIKVEPKYITEHKGEYEFYNLPVEERVKKIDELFKVLESGQGDVKTGRRILQDLRGGRFE
jgi:hypothetical protein